MTPVEPPVRLFAGPDGLELRACGPDAAPELVRGGGVVCAPHLLDTRSGPGRSLQNPLLKAAGIRKGDPWRPRVLDGTAGLGEDAWLLAAAGCQVDCRERHPLIHALLADGLVRAAAAAPEISARLRLLPLADSTAAADGAYEVVCLDPMFPHDPRRTALERKAMRLLRLAAGADTDADALLAPALAQASRRVVVKRPAHAPPLAGRKPDLVFEGKGHRFDVYLKIAAAE